MNRLQENFDTIFINLTPEQNEKLNKLRLNIAAVINGSPNRELPIEAVIEQGSITASREQMLGVLALAEDHIIVVDFGKGALSLTESGQSWLIEKLAQKPDVEVQSSDANTEINTRT
jgi:hypothetical protein